MKLHLPHGLRSALLVCLSSVSAHATTYGSGVVATSAVMCSLSVSFAQSATTEPEKFANDTTEYTIEENTCSNTDVSVSSPFIPMQLSESLPAYPNGNITYTTPIISSGEISGYETVKFANIISSPYDGVMCNYSDFTRLCGNGEVSFSKNFSSTTHSGGAICNHGGFILLCGNDEVTFSKNFIFSSYSGGAIYNNFPATFTLRDNGNVLFEKNYNKGGGIYCLRSIYSQGMLNLSAPEGKSILFNDSIYARGTVHLNQDGTGNIIFSGATTEADLREVKGGMAGTAQEIDASRSSVLDATATLDGGTLQVRDGASLTVKNLTAAACSELVLHDASFTTTSDSTLAAVTVSGTSSLSAQAGATLTLQQQITNNGVLTLSGTINADALELKYVDSGLIGYINAAGESDTSGFSALSSYYLLIFAKGTGTVHATDAVITHRALPSGATLILGGNGVISDSIDYSTYYINGDSATLSGILAMSPSAAVQMAGGCLVIDTETDTEIRHDNTASLHFTTHITHLEGSKEFAQYNTLVFDCISNHYDGAIRNDSSFSLTCNGEVSFKNNSNFSKYYTSVGAIYNDYDSSFTLSGNGEVTFCENSASSCGAILNHGTFLLNDNDNVTFSRNSAADEIFGLGGAIQNHGTFLLCGNGSVSFIGNSGGAIHNFSGTSFSMMRNGDISFCGNSLVVTYGHGGAISNIFGSFTLSGNGNVLFEKNVEISNGTYRLRSIYSEDTLNLSALEGKSIMFKDSVYARDTVNLNQDGTGDIIFSGATTETDLREVKGGVGGTAEEILESRTSELATNAKLYGGRLIVEDGAILKGRGITVTDGANATIRLNGGTLDETGYAIAVSSGSGLEFEGENTLAASAVSLAGGCFLNFVLGEAKTAVNWNANLDIQGGLTLNLTHAADKPVHDTYALLAMQSSNTVTGWDAANLCISGASAEYLVWENNTLYYRPMLVQENGDTTLDKDVDTDAAGGTIGGKDAVNIDGNGHTLTVKDGAQLVQMALKDGTVKLEGENNNVVSVTLTEGGELVLTAGAGLKTGDIISMVASGKGELVISGDITLDEHGMKGHEGKLATVSHADMKVLGDASISNVRVEDSTIDLLEGSTVNFTNVVLAATARITDDPATANLNDVYAELVLGVNTEQTGNGTLSAGSVLTQTGTGEALTLADDVSVLLLEATTFDSLLLTGTTLTLDLSGLSDEAYNGAAFIGISFTSGKAYATFDNTLEVLLTMDGITYTPGYTLGGNATTVYFRGGDAPVVPEPATATLSLLALAALAARRRRPLHKPH